MAEGGFVSLCRSADNMLYDVKRNGKALLKLKVRKICELNSLDRFIKAFYT